MRNTLSPPYSSPFILLSYFLLLTQEFVHLPNTSGKFPIVDKLISTIIITRKRRMESSSLDMKFKFTFA